MDDLHFGGTTKEEVISGINDLIKLLACASFEVRKFASNHPDIVDWLLVDHRDLTNSHKFLGLMWNSVTDNFSLNSFEKGSDGAPLTQRAIPTGIAQIFDPMGWVQPAIVSAKLLLQDMCRMQLPLNEEVSVPLQQQWNKIADSLVDLSAIEIPRNLCVGPFQEVESHGFADASQLAYGAVIYIKHAQGAAPCLCYIKRM